MEHAVTVSVNILKGDDVKKAVRKVIPLPKIEGGDGTVIHYATIKNFKAILDKAKMFDKLTELLKDMLL